MNDLKKKKKEDKRTKYIQERNQLIASEAMMTVLINTKATIVIGKPTSNCKISKPIINIISIQFDNGDSVDVDDCISKQMETIKKKMIIQKYDQKTIMNKMKRIKTQLLMELLIDVSTLLELPFTLYLHKTTKYKETIKSIVMNNKEYQGDEFITKGLELNEKINKMIRNTIQDRLQLPKNSIQL